MQQREVNDIAEAKQALRRRFRAARQAATPDEQARRSEALCAALLGLPELAEVRAVHAYWPALDRGEPDLRPLLRAWHRGGVEVLLPRVAVRTPPTLTHHVWDGRTPDASDFGLAEPASTLPLADLHRLDAVVVPALAVDGRGVRLGYGGGFYDAFLAALTARPVPPVLVCPVVADAFLPSSALPRDAHDVRVDLVVTEDGVYRVADPTPAPCGPS